MKYLKLQLTLKCNVTSDLSGGTCRVRVTHKGTPGWGRCTTLNKDQQRQEGLNWWTLRPGPNHRIHRMQSVGGVWWVEQTVFPVLLFPLKGFSPWVHLRSGGQCKHSQIMALMWILSHQKCKSVNSQLWEAPYWVEEAVVTLFFLTANVVMC